MTQAPLFKTRVLVAKQPLGDFYVAVIPADILLQTSYSHRLKAERQKDGTYALHGSQRIIQEPRLKQIGAFVDTVEAAFPNSIILAANFREDTGELETREDHRWKLDISDDGQTGILSIPFAEKLAAIIDGQHRLFGFRFAEKGRHSMPLVCAIYFDLPKPFQAFLFATINSNQKSVDKSQTYELFGYNVEDEPPASWTPDKLAVFLARKLNAEADSPFHLHVVIAAENDIVQSMSEARKAGGWMVSMATIVEGVLKLISKNPKNDASLMHEKASGSERLRSILEPAGSNDKTPLRDYFRQVNDTVIHKVVKNYFTAASNVFWRKEDPGFIRKTIGIQALFDILRQLLPGALKAQDISAQYFASYLSQASAVDFADDFFQASGTGRTRIRNTLEIALRLKGTEAFLSTPEEASYRRVLKPTGVLPK